MTRLLTMISFTEIDLDLIAQTFEIFKASHLFFRLFPLSTSSRHSWTKAAWQMSEGQSVVPLYIFAWWQEGVRSVDNPASGQTPNSMGATGS